MKKQFWLLMLLSGLLMFSSMFIACEEDDEGDPTDITLSDLYGTWVAVSGTPNFEQLTLDIGESSAAYYTSADTTFMDEFTMDVVELEIVFEDFDYYEDNDFAITYDFSEGNKIFTLTATVSGEEVTLVFMKYTLGTDDVDATLAKRWDLVTHSVDGTNHDGETGTLLLSADGTGSYESSEAELEEFDWRVVGNRFLQYSDNLGYVSTFTHDGSTLVATYVSSDGTEIYTFEEWVMPTNDDLVGTWMVHISTFDGVYNDDMKTVVFEESGIGVVHREEEDEHIDESFSWWVVGEDTLMLNFTNPTELLTIVYSIENGTLEATTEADEMAIHEFLVKVTGDTDTELLGKWKLNTIDGEPADVFETVELFEDGTGTFTEDTETNTFTWTVNNGKILVVNTDDILGFVNAYERVGDNFQVVSIDDEGNEELAIYIPYVEASGLDEDLYGTWVLDTLTINESLTVYRSTITFYSDGSVYWVDQEDYDQEPEEVYGTWTVEEGTITVIDDDQEYIYLDVTYVVDGSMATFTGTDEDQNDFSAVYYGLTSDIDSELVGRWVEVSMLIDGNPEISTNSTVNLYSDGTGSYHSLYPDEGEEGDETLHDYFIWAAYNGNIITASEEDGLGQVMTYEFFDGEAAFTSMEADEDVFMTIISTYHKFEGDNPAEYIGTWYSYLTVVENESGQIEPFQMSNGYVTLEVFADGTGTINAQEMGNDPNEDPIFFENDFEWFIDSDMLYIIEEDGLGQAMEQSLTGDFFELVQTIGMGEMGPATLTQSFVRSIEEFDATVVGSWDLDSVTQNGVPDPEMDEENLLINSDGTGTYTNPEENGVFTWESSNGYLIAAPDDEEVPDAIRMVIDYEIVEGNMVFTEYEVGFGDEAPLTIEVISTYVPATN
jgi:hypothetical protein